MSHQMKGREMHRRKTFSMCRMPFSRRDAANALSLPPYWILELEPRHTGYIWIFLIRKKECIATIEQNNQIGHDNDSCRLGAPLEHLEPQRDTEKKVNNYVSWVKELKKSTGGTLGTPSVINLEPLLRMQRCLHVVLPAHS